jgi:hypothetical protein
MEDSHESSVSDRTCHGQFGMFLSTYRKPPLSKKKKKLQVFADLRYVSTEAAVDTAAVYADHAAEVRADPCRLCGRTSASKNGI